MTGHAWPLTQGDSKTRAENELGKHAFDKVVQGAYQVGNQRLL
jgi:hypothetical protein